MSPRPYTVALMTALLCATAVRPAQAALGRGMSSVEADREHFAARMASVTAATPAVRQLSLPNGGTVQEYLNPDGVVFAVSWRGPGRPDLQQLLGMHFRTLQADNLRPDGRRTRRPLAVHRSDLVVQSGGHPGAFWGAALLPQQAPADFSFKDVR